MHHIARGLGIAAFAAVLAFGSRAHADLVLGVHPFKPAQQVTEAFSPLARYLAAKVGEPVNVRVARDYQAHVDSVGKADVDIAYLGPVPYVKLVDGHGRHRLLARQAIGGTPVFHGKIVVRQDSAIRTLADLKGKRMAFGEPRSTMSYLVPLYMLWQAGVPTDTLASSKFVGDHVNVALAVLSGDYDSGAVKEDVYFGYEKRGLRAIATSPPISDHLFVASARLPARQADLIREALLQIDRDPKGPEILHSLTPGVTALVGVKDEDYEPLRRVLRKLRELGVGY